MMREETRPKIGYARISTGDQKLDLQIDALVKFGVEREQIYSDQASGSKFDRPGLRAAMKELRPGDTLVVWKLDRLGRSVIDVLEMIKRLSDRDVVLISLTESLDGRTAIGKLMITILAGFAQMERDLIIERTLAGQKASRERGIVPGRRNKMTPEIEAEALALLAEVPPLEMNEIARRLKPYISRTKFFYWLRDYRQRQEAEADRKDTQ
jgi:DNA invertase Pin-like site-specific DNA recombinase